MFVEGYVDGKLKVDFVLVESTRYMQSKRLLLAKALVNVKDEEKCSQRFLDIYIRVLDFKEIHPENSC
jgi:hypothetical protein